MHSKKRHLRQRETLPLPSPAWIVNRPLHDGPRPSNGLHEHWIVRCYVRSDHSRFFVSTQYLHEWLRVLIDTPPDSLYCEAGHYVAGEWRGALVVAWPDTFDVGRRCDWPTDLSHLSPRPIPAAGRTQLLGNGVWS